MEKIMRFLCIYGGIKGAGGGKGRGFFSPREFKGVTRHTLAS